jgi:hypothetical protein
MPSCFNTIPPYLLITMVVGNVPVNISSGIFVERLYKGIEYLFVSRNFIAFALSSSSFINKNTYLSSFLNFWYNAINEGISALHGGHQDAQKLISITLPFRSAELMVVPPLAVKLKELGDAIF